MWTDIFSCSHFSSPAMHRGLTLVVVHKWFQKVLTQPEWPHLYPPHGNPAILQGDAHTTLGHLKGNSLTRVVVNVWNTMGHFLLLWLEKQLQGIVVLRSRSLIHLQMVIKSYWAERFGSQHITKYFWDPQGASGFPPGYFWEESRPVEVIFTCWGRDFSYWQKQHRIPFSGCSSFAQFLERGKHYTVQLNWFCSWKALLVITFSNICEGFLLFPWLYSTASNSSGFSH